MICKIEKFSKKEQKFAPIPWGGVVYSYLVAGKQRERDGKSCWLALTVDCVGGCGLRRRSYRIQAARVARGI